MVSVSGRPRGRITSNSSKPNLVKPKVWNQSDGVIFGVAVLNCDWSRT